MERGSWAIALHITISLHYLASGIGAGRGVAFPPLDFYRQYFCEGPSRLWERARYPLQEPFSQVQATGIPGFSIRLLTP